MITCAICEKFLTKLAERQTDKHSSRYKFKCPDCETIIILVISNELRDKLFDISKYLDNLEVNNGSSPD